MTVPARMVWLRSTTTMPLRMKKPSSSRAASCTPSLQAGTRGTAGQLAQAWRLCSAGASTPSGWGGRTGNPPRPPARPGSHPGLHLAPAPSLALCPLPLPSAPCPLPPAPPPPNSLVDDLHVVTDARVLVHNHVAQLRWGQRVDGRVGFDGVALGGWAKGGAGWELSQP